MRISEEEKDKLKKAFESNCESVTIRLTISDLHGEDVIALIKSQLDRLVKAYEKKKCMTIRISKMQLVHKHSILTPEKTMYGRNLRKKGHGRELPLVKTKLYKDSFVIRYYSGDDEHLKRLTSHIKEVLSIRDGRGLVCPGFSTVKLTISLNI